MAKAKFDLEEYKKTIQVADVPLKPDKYVELDPCLQEVLGIPGLPLGHITMCHGKSDVGKTSLLWHVAAKCQEQKILPVIIITEGKVEFSRAAAMGLKEGFVIINDNLEYLEDVFKFVDQITMDVSNGDIPYDVMILFDSIGNTMSREEVKVNKDGTSEKKGSTMKAAKCISEQMRIVSRRINDTRKVTYPKAVGLFVVNQSYTSPSLMPGIPPSLTPYGGTAVYYRSSLVLQMSRKSKLRATKDGKKVAFGIVASITVQKNHISNLAHTGNFVITEDAFLPNLKVSIDSYKDQKSKTWGESLEIESATEDEGGELEE